jgi:hypothetical protein
MLFRAFPYLRVKNSPVRPEVYASEENNFPSGSCYFKQVILVPMLFSPLRTNTVSEVSLFSLPRRETKGKYIQNATKGEAQVESVVLSFCTIRFFCLKYA